MRQFQQNQTQIICTINAKKDEKNAQKMRVGNYGNILQILQIYFSEYFTKYFTHILLIRVIPIVPTATMEYEP